ncbi:MAG: DUF5666 domain-containing protein [Candidatus Jettenia sp.]|nr:MAG: DUF5666 domain-containing protein [Candidatus Jettenia sp.]
MKHKGIGIIITTFLFCLGLPVVLFQNTIYGNSNAKAEMHGVVSSVLGSIISILNDTMDIDASKAKIKLEDCAISLHASDIAAGDVIEAKGYIKNDSFIAEKIKLKGSSSLEGIITEVGMNTITLMGQAIDINSALCIKGIPAVGKKANVYVRNSNFGLVAIMVSIE